MEPQKWQVNGERVVYQDRWVQVALAQVVLPNGRGYEYTTLRRLPGAAIVALNEQGEILLQREYRYPIDQVMLQLPGGLVDEGESPLAAARRELLEETGHQAATWETLGVIQDNPGLMEGRTTLFLARNLEQVAASQLDQTEFLVPQWVLLDWLRAELLAGKVVDRVVLAAWAFIAARNLV